MRAADAPWVVIVTVEADAALLHDLIAHARAGLELFADFDGFLGGALHVDPVGTRMVQVVRWTSEAAYVACRDHPSWDDLPSARRFLEAVRSGAATMDARGYRLVAST